MERAKPKLIILNIDAGWLFKSEETYERLSDLYPYYWDYRSILKPILSLKSSFVDFKLFFKSYQTNSTIIHAIKYYFFPQIDFSGYRPLFGEMEHPNNFGDSKEILPAIKQKEIDENFILAFNSFITDASDNNIRLIFVMSPISSGADFTKNKSMIQMRRIAEERNIPFIDFSNDEHFLYKYNLFYDASHLNNEGAHLFTKLLIELVEKTDTFTYSTLNLQ